MKRITYLFTPLLLLPTLAVAHPGHDHGSLHSLLSHMPSTPGPYLNFFGLVLLAAVSVWLIKRI